MRIAEACHQFLLRHSNSTDPEGWQQRVWWASHNKQ